MSSSYSPVNPTMEMSLDPRVGADVGSIGKTSRGGGARTSG